VAEDKVNIDRISFANRADHTTFLYLTLEINGLAQLSRILAKVEGVRGVMSVTRVGDEAAVKPSSAT
jgi:GTP pyrophosphokinase